MPQNIKGLKLAEVCRLNPNDLVGHTEQTFYACFSWFGRRDPIRSAIFWFPSKSTRDAFVKAYDPYAWAVERSYYLLGNCAKQLRVLMLTDKRGIPSPLSPTRAKPTALINGCWKMPIALPTPLATPRANGVIGKPIR